MDKKITDAVLDDYKAFAKQLGKHDRDKMDEYLTAVNEAEIKIKRAEKWAGTPFLK